jgi:hypothetical protein
VCLCSSGSDLNSFDVLLIIWGTNYPCCWTYPKHLLYHSLRSIGNGVTTRVHYNIVSYFWPSVEHLIKPLQRSWWTKTKGNMLFFVWESDLHHESTRVNESQSCCYCFENGYWPHCQIPKAWINFAEAESYRRQVYRTIRQMAEQQQWVENELSSTYSWSHMS